jgi:LCP family protein required for cell wall assembly
LSQAAYKGSARRAPKSEGSAAVAAVLSFIFPGLGHAYLGRRREALTFAVPVLVLFVILGVWILSLGFTRAGAKLLDPTFAALAAILSLVLVVWWAAGIISAYRAGRQGDRATVLVPIALVLTLLMITAAPAVPLGAAWFWQLSANDLRLYDHSNDPFTATATAAPTVTLAPGQTASPTPTKPPDYVDPSDDPDASDPPATIVPGTAPPIDITQLDAHDDGWLNVLVIGIDKTEARQILTGARSDTMIVVSTNPQTSEVYMFSFPRDTAGFPIYNGGTYDGKLNTFAGHTKDDPRFDGGGGQALTYEIGFLLGMPIDYYASGNMDGFQQLVDEVGGVTVCNSHDLNDEHLGFNLSAGLHTLNGADALRYARSRHGMGGGDFARARRQQQLLSAIRNQITQPGNIANLPNIVSAMAGVINTNFPPDQIDQLVTLANQVQKDPTAQYVFDFPQWADHPPAGQNNGRSQQFLRMDKVAALSQTIFGDKSLYWTGKPVPTSEITQPSPSDTPEPAGTQC